MIAALRSAAARHAPAVATAVLVLTGVGTVGALLAARSATVAPHVGAGEMVYVACQVLPYGLVGAVLVARRPDLPFGWLLSLNAVLLTTMLAVGGASVVALVHGNGGRLAVWGLTAGSLMFVPAVVEGLVNVRFPSGLPSGRWGRVLERALVVGIVVGVLSGVLGGSVIRTAFPEGLPEGLSEGGTGLGDGTALTRVADAATVAVPIVILLGVLAGLGVVVRFVRSTGVERLQLRWRAVGVVGSLLLFPFAVTETLPDAVSDVGPTLFVATLVVPVLRYDLWTIDSIIRRSAVHLASSPGTVVQNLVRATAEMLRLSHVAVRRGDRVLACYGTRNGRVESWPLVHEGETVGHLDVTPPHGVPALSEEDRQILATIAHMVAGSVRAEALTADLLDARQRLVTAREEERRRLRRDLHDGLGPLLTGLGLNLDAAAARLDGADPTTVTYLGNAKVASSQVISSLRELVEGLRPPALDELGLAGALRLHLEALAADAGLVLELSVPDTLVLPAAVEVASFRTAVEAVTNVARHSTARRVRVEVVDTGGRLLVTVTDDGRGEAPGHASGRSGTGIVGLRERAEELGGSFTAGPTADGWRAHATYPVEAAP